MSRSRPIAALLAAALLALTGCGGAGGTDSRPEQDATLMLDGPPGAVDAGLYLALERGYDEAEGVGLRLQTPETPASGVRALADGQADLAILDLHDLAVARDRGRDLVAVMAIVQTPLAALVARPGIAHVRALAGRRVAVAGRPSDRAVVRALAGPRVRLVHAGPRPLRAVLRGRADAALGTWTADGLELRARRPGSRAFTIDDLGAPQYPELVLATSRETLDTKGPVVRAAVRALRRGYQGAIDDPDSALTAMTDAVPSLRRDALGRELDAVSPSFQAGVPEPGVLNPAALRPWARWERRVGIVRHPVDVAAMVDRATSVAQ